MYRLTTRWKKAAAANAVFKHSISFAAVEGARSATTTDAAECRTVESSEKEQEVGAATIELSPQKLGYNQWRSWEDLVVCKRMFLDALSVRKPRLSSSLRRSLACIWWMPGSMGLWVALFKNSKKKKKKEKMFTTTVFLTDKLPK